MFLEFFLSFLAVFSVVYLDQRERSLLQSKQQKGGGPGRTSVQAKASGVGSLRFPIRMTDIGGHFRASYAF
jgi:hypothetical protein